MGEAGLLSLGVQDGQVCPATKYASELGHCTFQGTQRRPATISVVIQRMVLRLGLLDKTSPTFLEGTLQHALKISTYLNFDPQSVSENIHTVRNIQKSKCLDEHERIFLTAMLTVKYRTGRHQNVHARGLFK